MPACLQQHEQSTEQRHTFYVLARPSDVACFPFCMPPPAYNAPLNAKIVAGTPLVGRPLWSRPNLFQYRAGKGNACSVAARGPLQRMSDHARAAAKAPHMPDLPLEYILCVLHKPAALVGPICDTCKGLSHRKATLKTPPIHSPAGDVAVKEPGHSTNADGGWAAAPSSQAAGRARHPDAGYGSRCRPADTRPAYKVTNPRAA